MRLRKAPSSLSAAHPVSDKARTRCDRMLPQDAIAWADNALSDINHAIFEYGRYYDADSLAEAKRGALVLLGCLESLDGRKQAS